MHRRPNHPHWHYECDDDCGSDQFLEYATEFQIRHTNEHGTCGMGQVEDLIIRGVTCKLCGAPANIIIEH